MTALALRRIRYLVAASLDGFISGPNGEADWIVSDPEIDFGEIWAQFDTIVMGRRTFEPMAASGGSATGETRTIVISTTLRQADYPKVTVFGEDWEERLRALRTEPGKDIWLFGGGTLFRSLLQAQLVDTVEVAIMPMLLGGGIPLIPPPAPRTPLTLTAQRVYKSGIVQIEYGIRYGAEPGTSKRKPRATRRRTVRQENR